MPRTARHTVEFSAEGTTWTAIFGHEHFDPPFRTPKGLAICHQTDVDIFPADATGKPFGGVARCSIKDWYNWRVGIKLAFERALTAMGFATEVKLAGKPTFIPLDRQKWGEFHHAFYTEMRNRPSTQPNGRGLK